MLEIYENWYTVLYTNLAAKVYVICRKFSECNIIYSEQDWIPTCLPDTNLTLLSLLTPLSPLDRSKFPIDNYRISISLFIRWNWQEIWHRLYVLVRSRVRCQIFARAPEIRAPEIVLPKCNSPSFNTPEHWNVFQRCRWFRIKWGRRMRSTS